MKAKKRPIEELPEVSKKELVKRAKKFAKNFYKRIEYYSKLLLFNKKNKHWQDPYTD